MICTPRPFEVCFSVYIAYIHIFESGPTCSEIRYMLIGLDLICIYAEAIRDLFFCIDALMCTRDMTPSLVCVTCLVRDMTHVCGGRS